MQTLPHDRPLTRGCRNRMLERKEQIERVSQCYLLGKVAGGVERNVCEEQQRRFQGIGVGEFLEKSQNEGQIGPIASDQLGSTRWRLAPTSGMVSPRQAQWARHRSNRTHR